MTWLFRLQDEFDNAYLCESIRQSLQDAAMPSLKRDTRLVDAVSKLFGPWIDYSPSPSSPSPSPSPSPATSTSWSRGCPLPSTSITSTSTRGVVAREDLGKWASKSTSSKSYTSIAVGGDRGGIVNGSGGGGAVEPVVSGSNRSTHTLKALLNITSVDSSSKRVDLSMPLLEPMNRLSVSERVPSWASSFRSNGDLVGGNSKAQARTVVDEVCGGDKMIENKNKNKKPPAAALKNSSSSEKSALFTCAVCKARFNSAGALSSHQGAKQHSDKEWPQDLSLQRVEAEMVGSVSERFLSSSARTGRRQFSPKNGGIAAGKEGSG